MGTQRFKLGNGMIRFAFLKKPSWLLWVEAVEAGRPVRRLASSRESGWWQRPGEGMGMDRKDQA